MKRLWKAEWERDRAVRERETGGWRETVREIKFKPRGERDREDRARERGGEDK